MPKRWSKLQRRLYTLIDPTLDFQIHCALYEMNSKYGYHGAKLPRYFITIDKRIVFDYPKDFIDQTEVYTASYPWNTDIGRLSHLIEEYIQRPESEILNPFEDDHWGITDILRVCDKRVGKRRLIRMKSIITNEELLKIVHKRLS